MKRTSHSTTKKFILGIVDGYGAVDSKAFDTCRAHEKIFPGMWSIRWRWCDEYGLRETDQSKIHDDDLRWRIEGHLEKKYGLVPKDTRD